MPDHILYDYATLHTSEAEARREELPAIIPYRIPVPRSPRGQYRWPQVFLAVRGDE